MSIKNIVIAGGGTMGYSMAQIFARYNYTVTIYDISEDSLDNAKKRICENLDNLVENNDIEKQDITRINGLLTYTTNKECFKDCDLVVECIIENLEIKQSFFNDISNIVRDDTIIATNTSGLSINELAKDINKPERFIGMHWFNPAHLILLIEIIKGDHTSKEVADTIYQLCLDIDKKPVIVNKDIPGFAANRIQFAILREALSLVEEGVVSKEGIDDVMKYGLGFRYACLGPLEVADFGGLDTFYHISEYLIQDLSDTHEVSPLLKELYDNGNYGVKTQKGFYDYHDGKDVEATKKRDEKLLKVFNALYK